MQAKAKSPNFFYQGYSGLGVNFDAAYEAQQIKLFIKLAAKHISKFATGAEADYTGYAALLDKNYKGFQARSLEGFPGMADATGISTINGYNGLKQGTFTKYFASLVLPSSPGITDFMSVWEQGERKAEWSKDHKQLINGGGQWRWAMESQHSDSDVSQYGSTINHRPSRQRYSCFGVWG
jgi:hypothetical protein